MGGPVLWNAAALLSEEDVSELGRDAHTDPNEVNSDLPTSKDSAEEQRMHRILALLSRKCPTLEEVEHWSVDPETGRMRRVVRASDQNLGWEVLRPEIRTGYVEDRWEDW